MQPTTVNDMGSLSEIWQRHKDLILLGGLVVGVICFVKKNSMTSNPNGTLGQARLALGHIDEFASVHSPKEVAQLLGNIEKQFPSIAGRVATARARVL